MATRQTRRQLQFTSLEMAMIAVSFVITVTAVFFLGLFVGRKNATMHAPPEDRVARIPVDDFTKYKKPPPIPAPPKESHPGPEAAAAAAPAAATAAKGSGAPAADASKAAAPAAAAAADTAKAAASDTAKSSAPVDAAAKAQPPSAKDAAAKDAAAKDATAKDAAAKQAAAKDATKDATKDKDKADEEAATGRGYTVQILATRKQADADALVHKLKSRGYAAYIKKVSDGAGDWFRVRVGSYGAFSEARAMADRCRRDLGLGQAFVSTE